MINNFKNKFCINLDRRPDKWKEVQEEFSKHNIDNIIRISGVDGNPDNLKTKLLPGEVGCLLSHLKILNYAKENNLENILVFEDDVVFIENFNILFNDYLKQIPNDWDMIYFCGNHQGREKKFSNNVLKLNFTFTTHSYIMKNNMYDLFINKICKLEKQVDVYYAEEHSKHNVYCFYPHITFQRPGISDIQEGFMDYTFLK